MKTLSKDEILKKFPIDSPCRVWYKNQDNPVEYSSLKNIRWKQAIKITVKFSKPKVLFDKKYGENVSRDGVSFLIGTTL